MALPCSKPNRGEYANRQGEDRKEKGKGGQASSSPRLDFPPLFQLTPELQRCLKKASQMVYTPKSSLLIRKALDFRPYMPGAQVTVEKGNRLG